MSVNDANPVVRFTVQGDGRYRGDDGSSGELAGTTLYIVRALEQIDQLLRLGELSAFRAQGGPQELDADVGHDGDFGLEVVGRLTRTEREPVRPEGRALGATLGNELDTVLDMVTQVDLVAGCFVVSTNGNLLVDRVPGVGTDSLAGTGRRMKVAYDAFDRFLGTTSLVTTFTWARLVAAPVGNGLAVAIADLTSDVDAVLSAIHVGGGVLSGVDLAAFRASALTE